MSTNIAKAPPQGSLAAALLLAAEAVAAVTQGTALPAALASVFNPSTTPETRGAAQDIAYRCMRRLGTADAVIQLVAARPPQPALLASLLQCAVALLLDPQRPYEPYTVVDQAVDAIASNPHTAHTKGMVNAVLRRILREEQVLTQQVLSRLRARWNYPDWWVRGMQQAWPQQWESILMAGNAAPPLTLRVNRRKCEVPQYLELLAAHGMQGIQLGPQAVRVMQPVPVARLPGFADGLVSVQDAAAQLAAPLLDLHDGQRVLDACAAPGGKTCHMLELAELDLTALDVDPLRLRRVQENLDRTGLTAKLVQGDAAGAGWWDGAPFDRILADLPCTASGIVRRHPDIRWLRRPEDASRLARHSASILDNLWRMLAPGGKLLLVTCSLWPEESALQAQAFAARTGARPLPAPGQLLPEANPQQDHDGLFYALFQKAPV
ncbi:16S rRNA (cytosine(967)-C(5))-methyltransferase RsmB [Lacisediminimonas profundi]|uniref:16S rRNA (cytosine(967)-C(5))-methyltransferase RsmB n=1 Tax=Lacisediminimonas profundi TaxID=2603856 RepID=UPI00124B24AC|nr:16S rRNA (cytosine(967)-C(5))-methyltransferase RsmB [Lacisediminimonas profundi]